MNARFILAIAATVLLMSCEQIANFANMESLEIDDVNPAGGFLGFVTLQDVSIRFSESMNRTSAEDAFDLTFQDESISGRFQWSGERELRFVPLSALSSPGIYTMTVGTGAEDRYGNSLVEEFTHRFTIGTENQGPVVVGSTPSQGEEVLSLRPPISIEFSEPMRFESLFEAFSISPNVSGALELSADQTLLSYRLLEDLSRDTEYGVELSSEARDLSGNALAVSYSATFATPRRLEPTVVGIVEVLSGTTLQDADAVYLNNALGVVFEKNSEFTITFDRPLDVDEIAGAVSISNGAEFSQSWDALFSEVSITFDEPLIWAEIYEISTGGKTYRFLVDGPRSLPPSVASVTYSEDVSAATPVFEVLTLGDSLAFATSPTAAVDVYFDRSPFSDIDLASFADAFSISATNSAVTFSPLRIEKNPTAPMPDPAPGADQSVLRVLIDTTDDPALTGVVEIEIQDTLRDTSDNRMEAAYSLSVNES